MAKKPNLKTITSGYAATTALNENFEALRDALDNTVSRDGSVPNSMSADLDMNSQDILNVNTINTSSMILNGILVTPSGVDPVLDGTVSEYMVTLLNDEDAATARATLDAAASSHTHVVADITDFTDNSTNWNTAYGWGDHSVAGYLTGNQTITLSGDLSGSGTTSINAQIAANVVGANELNVSGNGTAGQALTSDGDGSFSWADAGGGWEVIASGGDTANTAVSSIEVTGLSDYQYVVGYLMAETSSSSDIIYLQFSVDSGAYTTLNNSGTTAAGNDTYASRFTMAPKPASGYVAMTGLAQESTNVWSTTSGEIHNANEGQGQMSYPATTGITGVRWLISGGTMQYWRYVVMGIK